MTEETALDAAVQALATALRARGWTMATAESCTGGMIAAACTSLAGSSDWFERGFVTYSNLAKTELLGVDAKLIAEHGAVSEEVVRAMVRGAWQRAGVDIAVAVTGIAGPGGAVPGKPVGTVWLGWGGAWGVTAVRLQLTGDRGEVRRATMMEALRRLTAAAQEPVLDAGAAPDVPPLRALLCGDFDPGEEAQWREALALAAPQARWLSLDEARASPGAVQAALVANPPPGSLQGLPGLRLIQSLWAGVDRLLADTSLPAGVPVARMVDPAMNAAMAETALWATLALQRGYFAYARQQRESLWRTHAQRRAQDLQVLVLGQGQMGTAAAAALARQGLRVRGWRRDGTPLVPLLATSDVVINLLPLTAATRGLIDAAFLAALPRGAGLVNLARGAHVVDADLLAALDSGHLGHAVLDVFHTEPLPVGHPFWQHPRVTVLPHAAAFTDPRSAAQIAVANVQAALRGETPAHLVERGRGY